MAQFIKITERSTNIKFVNVAHIVEFFTSIQVEGTVYIGISNGDKYYATESLNDIINMIQAPHILK